VSSTATVEITLTEAQRRALAPYYGSRRDRDIGWVVLVVVWVGLTFGRDVSSDPSPALRTALPWILAAVVLISMSAMALIVRSYRSARQERIVNRTTGDMSLKTRYNDDGPDIRFIEAEDREIVVDSSVPDIFHVGAIEYTAKRGYPLAIWDTDGVLGWCAEGYEPSTLRAGSMRVPQ